MELPSASLTRLAARCSGVGRYLITAKKGSTGCRMEAPHDMTSVHSNSALAALGATALAAKLVPARTPGSRGA
eukprot:9024931-Pyramimonas_sp.AAC.1